MKCIYMNYSLINKDILTPNDVTNIQKSTAFQYIGDSVIYLLGYLNM